MVERGHSTAVGAGVLLAFFVSGICGLIHQVVWTRLLRLVMGNDTFAITTVLCVFMGGLALGSYLAGRWIERRRDALRVFAVLEGAIGVYCLALPLLISATEPIYELIYRNTHASFYVFSLIRFLFSGALVLLPATFMGATLPVLTRFFVHSSARVGWSVGTLYAINTFGAVVGAAGAGFVLLPSLGVTWTIVVACGLNIGVGVTGFLLYRRTLRWSPSASPATDMTTEPASSAATGAPQYGSNMLVALLIGYGCAGFASLVYEVAWSRTLSLLFVSSVYAFSLMLTAFVLGIAVGSLAFARFVDRIRDPVRALAVIEVAIGLSAMLVVPFVDRLPFLVTDMMTRVGGSFWVLQLVQFGTIAMIMLLPTTLMGAAFPLASRIHAQVSGRISSSVGVVYASNTVGSILGAFVGGFVLIPVFGIQRTIFGAVAANVLVGAGFFLLSRGLPLVRRAALAGSSVAVAAAAFAMLPQWDPSRMSFGPFFRAIRLQENVSAAELDELAARDAVVFHDEGLSATVTVKKDPDGVLTMLINGVPEASSAGRQRQQRLLAHIPILLHNDPQRVLLIGLASGITLGSAGRHDVDTLDCVELSPAVIDATKLFTPYNHGILDDPRVRILVTDGRNHLALTEKAYDVIISQPSNPWVAGVADLFTIEFFELCRDRLAENGVACVWLQSGSLDPEAFASIVRTFIEVFPQMNVWRAARSDLLLIGARDGFNVDLDTLARRMQPPDVATDLASIGVVTIADLLENLFMGAEAAGRHAGDSAIHTDDNALLEFAAPRSLARPDAYFDRIEAIDRSRDIDLSFLAAGPDNGSNVQTLEAELTRRLEASAHVTRGNAHWNKGERREAAAAYVAAAAANPDEPGLETPRKLFLRQAARFAELERFPEAIGLYEATLQFSPRSQSARYEVAMLLVLTGKLDRARLHLEEAVRLAPTWPLPANELAWILATAAPRELRDPAEALRLAELAARLTQYGDPDVLDTLAAAHAAMGRFDEAIPHARRALELDGGTRDRREIEARLEGYRSSEPYRQPGR